MKILHVNKPWFPVPTQGYGGTEKVLFDLIQSQIDRYSSVGLVANRQSNIDGAFNYSNFDNPLAGQGFDRRMEDAVAAQAVKVFQEFEFDVIHAHSIEAILPLVSYLNIPTVFTHHCIPTEELYAIWDTLPKSSNIRNVFISQAQKDSYQRIEGSVVHHGINLDDFEFNQTQREDYLVFVGAITPQKGVKEAVEIAKLSKKKLVIAGTKIDRYPRYYDEVMKLVYKNENVEFIGEVNDAQRNQLVSQAKYFLFTSLWEEPFGRVLLESLAVGTPVLAFRKGSAIEILREAPQSVLFDDVISMVKFIKETSEQKNAKEIRDYVQTYFSTARMVDSYHNVYRTLI
jgi:glycosyltransferase involved in cell wall biosynthesis